MIPSRRPHQTLSHYNHLTNYTYNIEQTYIYIYNEDIISPRAYCSISHTLLPSTLKFRHYDASLYNTTIEPSIL